MGTVAPPQLVPDDIPKPEYYTNNQIPKNSTIGRIEIKTDKAIEHMRQSCGIAAKILKSCGNIVGVIIFAKFKETS